MKEEGENMTFYEELSKEKNPAIIQVGNYLLGREDIQGNLQKPNKSLKECWDYIVSEARKKQQGGYACLSDDEVYGMAIHYFDEDDIKYDKKAVTKLKSASTSKSVKKEKTKKKSEKSNDQLSLFGDLL